MKKKKKLYQEGVRRVPRVHRPKNETIGELQTSSTNDAVIQIARFGTVEEYDDAIFRRAEYFNVARKVGVGASQVQRFEDFPTAAYDAIKDHRAMVYAVTPEGRYVCLPRKRWLHFLEMWKSLNQ